MASRTVESLVLTQEEREAKEAKILLLRLREAKKAAVRWSEDTVDNENLGRRSSKRKRCRITRDVSLLILLFA